MSPSRTLRLTLALLLVSAPVAADSGLAVPPSEASRFLSQATFGANWEEIERTSEVGFEAWLAEQFVRPVGRHQPPLEELARLGVEVENQHRRWVWWERAMQGPDPLRQRVAFALSEIFVVSDNTEAIRDTPIGMANYYDMLLDNAFGNFRELLLDVSLHPIMGVYLSHLRNDRSDPSGGRFPDENYAREVMQLFSVGLFELRPDGTQYTDGDGEPVPTYDNSDITEFAKIFTGLAFDSPAPDFGNGTPVWTRPMRMYQEHHEPGPKYLLRGGFVPPGQTGMHDVADAIDNLFRHPNVGPFIGRRLIQRLVTSNPSPDYIRRVSAAFDDNGAGVRGDMRALVTAILTDPEARQIPNRTETTRGRLRESYLRRVHLARAFDAANLVGSYPITDGGAPTTFGQLPISSPTVFNFFLPDHQPTGELADAGLYAPEFQIMTAVTAIASANALQRQVEGLMNDDDDPMNEVRLDLSNEIAIAANSRALVDRLDLLLMYGDMSVPMKEILVHALDQLPDPIERVEMAIHLISIAPEYAVQK
ncbi:MAG TPA: DUF1800 domain-containing protein [Candidatus Polarisedimenticolaceae bacterium]|nr:DUF1800 domain-containing protein [Candidatus Polarisedimenticolaceae bacterium]